MLSGSGLMDAVRSWLAEQAAGMRGDGIGVEVREWFEGPGPGAVQLTLEIPLKAAEIMVWEDGNAELVFYDFESRTEVPEHRDIRSGADLEDALRVTAEWVGKQS
ncbi:hypothetical protein AB8O64_28270 [Streptomyces sp. QH1-20]|uniref:hypothetical protein n=1 Tax=Streptomyces sp. QH1-20 TaxID=3240934 RepID=UPI0035113F2F